MTTFSIVINTLNRASFLRNTLESLRYLRHPCFEVIIVNGPSTDDTKQVVAKFDNFVKFAECDTANLSLSRNIGIMRASGDVVCFIDDDAVPEPDWLNQLEPYYADRIVGAVGGYTRDHTGVAFQARALVCSEFGDSKNFNEVEDALKFLRENSNYYFSQTGTNSSFRRTALLKVGGFDEHYAYFLDETDVNLRIVQAGYQVVYAPTAEIHHKYAPSHLRNERRVPSSLFKPASSKAYFAFRNAARLRSLSEILEHLAAYEVDIRGYNKWYLENNVVNAEEHRLLDESLAEGIRHGIRTALKEQKRKLLDGRSTAAVGTSSLKAFPTLLRPTERLRICLLSQEYPPSACGGIGVWTATTAWTLASLGHEVTVVTKDVLAGASTVDFEDGVWVHRIKPAWQPTRTEPQLPDLPQITKDYCYSLLDELRRIQDRRGIDIASAPIWDLEGAAILRSAEIPTVLSLHTTFKLALPSKSEWRTNSTYFREHVNKIIAGEKEMLQEAPYILANSRALIRDIEEQYAITLPPKRLWTIPHGLEDQSENYPNSSNADLTTVLFVGRFEPRKGVPELLASIETLAPLHPDVEFVLAGDNTLLADGKRLWEEFSKRNAGAEWLSRVCAPGQITRSELFQQFARCDIFVAPSRYESFGLIFIEAMMFGKPCVGTTAGGIAEIIEDQKTGILVPPSDREALTLALRKLIQDRRLRESMGVAARTAFKERFTALEMANRLLGMYQEILAQQTSRKTTASAVAS